MRGVPLLMTSLMTSALPPSEFIDSTGAYCGLTSCGLVWQTRQDWLNSRMPTRGWSAPPAGCADAASGDMAGDRASDMASESKTVNARRLMWLFSLDILAKA